MRQLHFIVPLAILAALPSGIAWGAPDQMLHFVFNGKGTSTFKADYGGGNTNTETANLEWHASWDVPINSSFAGTGYYPALPGTTLTGNTSVNFTSAGVQCQGSPVINTYHGGGPGPATPQTPGIGFGPDITPGSPSSVKQMWVETYGGDDYRLCDGASLAGVGFYGDPEPGYPAWDTRAGIAKFNIDLNDWLGQSDKTMTIPVQGDFTGNPDPYVTSEAHWSGSVIVSTKSCNPGDANCKVLVRDLRFANDLGSSNSKHVIRDRLASDGSDQAITDVMPNCGAPADAHYVACTTPSSPDKDWPAAIVQGNQLMIDEVTFRRVDPSDTSPLNGTLNGDADSGDGVQLSFQSPITMGPSDQTVTLTGLQSQGSLPNDVRLVSGLKIHWTIQQDNGTLLDAGTSSHPLFLLLNAPLPPGADAEAFITTFESPFVTMLAIASDAATGDSDAASVENDVWSAFRQPNRDGLKRVELDTSSGALQAGAPLKFWQPGWSLLSWLSGQYSSQPGQTVQSLLHDGVSTCHGFATLWAGMLRLEGVGAKEIAIDARRNWGDLIYLHSAQYFLVGSWRNGQALGALGPYPLVDGIVYTPDGNGGTNIDLDPVSSNFASSTGQNNTTPVSMWRTALTISTPFGNTPIPVNALFAPTADHVLTQTEGDGQIWDPSYGNGPFQDLAGWAAQSITGWARFVDGDNNQIEPDTCPTQRVCFLQIEPVSSGP